MEKNVDLRDVNGGVGAIQTDTKLKLLIPKWTEKDDKVGIICVDENTVLVFGVRDRWEDLPRYKNQCMLQP